MTEPKQLHSFTTRYSNKINVIFTDLGISLPTIHSNQKETIHKIKAIWDTGATNTTITKALATNLKLKPVGKVTVKGVNSTSIEDTYLLDIYLPNKVVVKALKVTECSALSSDFKMLIGMDIIGLGDFAITNKNNKTTLSFCLPSLAEIDFNPLVNDYNLKHSGLNRQQRRLWKKKHKR
ncbi:MAG: retroviral-like aspartic protease family protein [Candidatus Cloacimonetes bacterium]|nr:retroviral-like aspartic protease family protein [Candidatus Cloacimonadota bacterium]